MGYAHGFHPRGKIVEIPNYSDGDIDVPVVLNVAILSAFRQKGRDEETWGDKSRGVGPFKILSMTYQVSNHCRRVLI